MGGVVFVHWKSVGAFSVWGLRPGAAAGVRGIFLVLALEVRALVAVERLHAQGRGPGRRGVALGVCGCVDKWCGVVGVLLVSGVLDCDVGEAVLRGRLFSESERESIERSG